MNPILRRIPFFTKKTNIAVGICDLESGPNWVREVGGHLPL